MKFDPNQIGFHLMTLVKMCVFGKNMSLYHIICPVCTAYLPAAAQALMVALSTPGSTASSTAASEAKARAISQAKAWVNFLWIDWFWKGREESVAICCLDLHVWCLGKKPFPQMGGEFNGDESRGRNPSKSQQLKKSEVWNLFCLGVGIARLKPGGWHQGEKTRGFFCGASSVALMALV